MIQMDKSIVKVTIFDDKIKNTVQEIQIRINYKENLCFGNFSIVNSSPRVTKECVDLVKKEDFNIAYVQFISLMINNKVTAIPETWNKNKLVTFLEKFLIKD